MKGLFNDVKKEPSNAGIFKFSFKLGGELESEEDEPCNSSVKKNKKKKKKKKASTKISDIEAVLDTDDKEPNENISDVQIQLSQMSIVDTISSDITCCNVDIAHALLSNDGELKVTEDVVTEKVLSKSQKKNMKRSKAKKSSDQPNAETENKQGACEMVNNAVKGTKPFMAKQTITSSELTSNNKSSSPIEPTGSKSSAQHNSSKSSSSPIRSKSVYVPPTGSGPHFLSAKDPELDEATKQRFRFGMGRNLVAIGPAKVRDPNWLPPPPGLTRKPPISTASTTGSVKSTSGGLGGLFGKKEGASAAGRGSTALGADSGGISSAPVEVSHSSPFSFSFNGL